MLRAGIRAGRTSSHAFSLCLAKSKAALRATLCQPLRLAQGMFFEREG